MPSNTPPTPPLCGDAPPTGAIVHNTRGALTAQISDDQIIGVLCDLFAGRTQTAFGQDLEWWAETFQCDLGPASASGLVLFALSDHPADLRAGAPRVHELRTQLLERAQKLTSAAGMAVQP